MGILYNDASIPLWPAAALVLIIAAIALWRRTRNPSFLFFFSIFGAYAFWAIDKVFFPIEVNGLYVDVMRKEPLFSRINFIPLYFGKYGLTPASFAGILNNILLTIPVGFGLNFIAKLKAKNFVALAFALGLGFEMGQLILSLLLRYPYRTIDVNDVILNATGVLIGYGLFRIFASLYLTVSRRFSIKQEGLSAYIYQCSLQAHKTNNAYTNTAANTCKDAP